MKERAKHIDVARGLAVLGIMMGHFWIDGIVRVVYPFHLSVFFLVSGYFLSADQPMRPFLKKKLRTLIVPYYLTSLVIILLQVLRADYLLDGSAAWNAAKDWSLAALYGAGMPDLAPAFFKQFIGAIWFLWATFFGTIFVKLSLKLRPPIQALFVITLFLVGYVSSWSYWLPLSIQAGCVAALWIYVGFLFRQAKPALEKLPAACKHAALWGALLVWLVFILNFKSFHLVRCDFGNGLSDVFGSFCAAYVIFRFSKKISTLRYIGDGLAYIGRYSLFVLCFHIIELDLQWQPLLFCLLENAGCPEPWLTVSLIVSKLFVVILLTVLAAHSRTMKRLFGFRDNRLAKSS